MTSKRSEKLKKGAIIGAAVFIVMAIAFFVLSNMMKNEADNLRESSSMLLDSSAKAQVIALESNGTIFMICGVLFLVCSAVIATLLLAIYYRTYITISDSSVKGVGVIGLKRTGFAAPVSEVQNLTTNGKNMLAFTIKGTRYAVYCDDVNVFYTKLANANRK